MFNYQEFKKELMKDSEFRKEFEITRAKALSVFKQLRKQTKDVPEMSLNQINAEISVARAERKNDIDIGTKK